MINKSLSVVVVCYRDEGSISAMLERLTKVLSQITDNYEIIYVNDASPDNSEKVLEKYAENNPHLTVINFSRNFGAQLAFTAGIEQSTGDGVILMDGDLQDPPEVIPKLVEKWLEGYDVVYGVRERRKGNIFRNFAYKVFYRIWKKIANIDIALDSGDFGIMDRKVVNILLNFTERDRFLRGLRSWIGFKQTGVPYLREERYAGESNNSFGDNIRWAKKAIFSFSYYPLEMISSLAFGCTILSLSAIIIYLALYFILPGSPRGVMTILLSVLFLGSIQLMGISFLGEYIGRIFEEIKGRPKYIVKNVLNNHKIKPDL